MIGRLDIGDMGFCMVILVFLDFVLIVVYCFYDCNIDWWLDVLEFRFNVGFWCGNVVSMMCVK